MCKGPGADVSMKASQADWSAGGKKKDVWHKARRVTEVGR